MPISMIFDIDIDLPGTESLLKRLNLESSGKVQQFFTNEVIRHSDKYVPFSSGVLKNSAMPSPDFESIIYTTPYARYHWFGKLMVDPITKKGAFYSPEYGFWSRPMTPKELTDTDMSYQGAPLRGSHWTERMWIDEGEEIIRSVEHFIERNTML